MGFQEDVEDMVTEEMKREAQLRANVPHPDLDALVSDLSQEPRGIFTDPFPPKLKKVVSAIDPAEVPYLQVVYKSHAEAQELLQRAMQLEAQALECRARATALVGSHDSYTTYLGSKYALIPGKDRIEADGRITRADQPFAALTRPDSGS